MLGYAFGKAALPAPILTLATSAEELTDAMYDAFAEDPRHKPIIKWLNILEEMASNQKYTKHYISSYSSAVSLSPKTIRDIAELIHNSAPDELYFTKHLGAASQALMGLKPTMTEIKACLQHPLIQTYGPELLVEDSVEETAKLLWQMSQASESQMQAFVRRLTAQNAAVDEGLFKLAEKFPDIQEEVEALQKLHQGEKPPQAKDSSLDTKDTKHYPAFSTKYRANAFPIPHDYYAKPKPDKWSERLKPQEIHAISAIR